MDERCAPLLPKSWPRNRAVAIEDLGRKGQVNIFRGRKLVQF